MQPGGGVEIVPLGKNIFKVVSYQNYGLHSADKETVNNLIGQGFDSFEEKMGNNLELVSFQIFTSVPSFPGFSKVEIFMYTKNKGENNVR